MKKNARKNYKLSIFVICVWIGFMASVPFRRVQAEENHQSKGSGITGDVLKPGYIENLETVDTGDKETLPGGGFVPSGIIVPSVCTDDEVDCTGAAVPASFDARTKGWVTPVKNQGNYNTCWSFSAISAGESSLISQGEKINGKKATASLDLSELHVAYFTYNPVMDPLGNTKGDTSTVYASNIYQLGGNDYYTVFSLASWTGAVAESTAPYKNVTRGNISKTLAFQDVAHLQDAYFISMGDVDSIKRQIMDNGSVVIGMYMDYQSGFLDTSNDAYYYNGKFGAYGVANHAVTVIGWDDNYPASNFTKNPGRNGAWLIKNSYGTDLTKDGYMWISYADYGITHNGGISSVDGVAVSYNFENADNYDNNYQYDGTGALAYIGPAGSITSANVFKAKAAGTNQTEELKAVSFYTFDPNIKYSIQVYKNLSSRSSPTGGTKVFSSPVNGTKAYAGYHTITLPKSVRLAKNTVFSVVITLSSGNGSMRVAVDASSRVNFGNGNVVQFNNATNAGESFINYNGKWLDTNNLDTPYTVRIKAFTNNVKAVKVSSIKLNSSWAGVKKGKSINLKATVGPTNVDNKKLNWTSSNKSVATVSSSGKVTGKGNGTAVITAAASDGSKRTAACKISVGYSITYKLNGGKNSGANPGAYYKQKVSFKSPTRIGYEFKGWYTDKKLKKKITVINKGSTKNYVLYAKWKKVAVSKPSIKKTVNVSGNKITLNYSVKDAKGYEIVYSTGKNFPSSSVNKVTTSKTSATLKGLVKGKTYYIKIRAYKKDSAGNKIYGKYSTVKDVKIRR